ncbi:MAG: hypothetical protein US49_C0011G0021 [candidate division TM6 bacterium GW2011_GWF2_37_49]|nr:MAG: hypothetical protein US49_C0011G0021 [candidate division TM6 bacterium GW2011_GWF2_37_49]
MKKFKYLILIMLLTIVSFYPVNAMEDPEETEKSALINRQIAYLESFIKQGLNENNINITNFAAIDKWMEQNEDAITRIIAGFNIAFIDMDNGIASRHIRFLLKLGTELHESISRALAMISMQKTSAAARDTAPHIRLKIKVPKASAPPVSAAAAPMAHLMPRPAQLPQASRSIYRFPEDIQQYIRGHLMPISTAESLLAAVETLRSYMQQPSHVKTRLTIGKAMIEFAANNHIMSENMIIHMLKASNINFNCKNADGKNALEIYLKRLEMDPKKNRSGIIVYILMKLGVAFEHIDKSYLMENLPKRMPPRGKNPFNLVLDAQRDGLDSIHPYHDKQQKSVRSPQLKRRKRTTLEDEEEYDYSSSSSGSNEEESSSSSSSSGSDEDEDEVEIGSSSSAPEPAPAPAPVIVTALTKKPFKKRKAKEDEGRIGSSSSAPAPAPVLSQYYIDASQILERNAIAFEMQKRIIRLSRHLASKLQQHVTKDVLENDEEIKAYIKLLLDAIPYFCINNGLVFCDIISESSDDYINNYKKIQAILIREMRKVVNEHKAEFYSSPAYRKIKELGDVVDLSTLSFINKYITDNAPKSLI